MNPTNKGVDFYKELNGFKTIPLSELSELIKGRAIPTNVLLEEGELLYLMPIHIQSEKILSEKRLAYINKDKLTDEEFKFIAQAGDIIISTIFNDFKMFVYYSDDIPVFVSNNLLIIRSSEEDYIFSYLQTEEGKKVFKAQAEYNSTNINTSFRLTIDSLSRVKIPILPLSQLNIIGNHSISKATSVQLQESLELLKEYKQQVIELKQANINSIKAFIEDRFDRIELQLNVVTKKLDKLLDVLEELKTDFSEIRKLYRDDEEKLLKLFQKIDLRLDVIYKKEKVIIENYVEGIKRWLVLWELLDIQSQKFLPIAEFIFDELSKIPEADYAPFVVQYCRTLENEILKKLFEAYHSEGLENVNRDELVKIDLEHPKIGKFAMMVKRNKKTYTLGDMNFIMSLLKQGGNSLKESLLLQHFKAFTIFYFDERIVQSQFLGDIDKLTSDFRNKAAHPYSIEIDMAKQCQELLRKCLNIFLESLKDKMVKTSP